MKHLFQHILFAVILSVIFFSLNSCKEKNIIDGDDMAKIYAEMLITDQWIGTTPGLRNTADTSLVYEPILKRYGYTSDDYRNSVEYYLNDPDDYADIINETVKILDKRLSELKKKKEGLDEEEIYQQHIKKLAKEINFPEAALYANIFKEEAYGQADSLSVVWDTLALCYVLRPMMKVEPQHLSDSLQIADTLVRPDTLDVLKDMPVLDSIPKTDTVKKIMKPTGLKPKNMKPLGTVHQNPAFKVSDTLTTI